MRLGGCASSGQAMCIAGLPTDQQPTVLHILSSLNRVVDGVGKAAAQSAKLLFMFEAATSSTHVHRVCAILVLARFSPKSQVWALCDFGPAVGSTDPALATPFEVIVSTRPNEL